MRLDVEQRGIRNGAVVALLLAICALGLPIMFQINGAEFGNPAAAAPILASAFAVLAISLATAIARLARHRFAEPLDRNAAAVTTATDTARQHQAILTNTHEQATLAALVYLIAAITLPAAWSDCISAAALLFAAGRFFFTIGYAKGAAARAFGFGLTFYPTVMLGLLSLTAAFR
jgi:hypothetical protein